jgi:hypothetical protein
MWGFLFTFLRHSGKVKKVAVLVFITERISHMWLQTTLLQGYETSSTLLADLLHKYDLVVPNIGYVSRIVPLVADSYFLNTCSDKPTYGLAIGKYLELVLGREWL